jgi:hypothetical protein
VWFLEWVLTQLVAQNSAFHSATLTKTLQFKQKSTKELEINPGFMTFSHHISKSEVQINLTSDGWRVVDDDDYGQVVGNPKRKV